jgi:2-iminobutanoate/2-iminopropanoate deaminase
MKGIIADNAPKPYGPFSQAIQIDNLLFCSGQVAFDPTTNKIVEGGIEKETLRVLQSLNSVIQQSGLTINQIVKVNVYLVNISHFEKMNAVYQSFFGNHRPARTTVQVAGLLKGALVEMDCQAVVPRNQIV